MRRFALVLGIVASFAAIIAFAALAWLGVRSGQVVCVVENETSQMADVTVSIYDMEYTAKGLSPGGSFSFEFEPAADAHYEVEVTLESGASYKQNVGYVTSGVSLHHRIVVGDDAVKLTATTEQ
jgi:hypothetical protein